jgi:hypothetical protein
MSDLDEELNKLLSVVDTKKIISLDKASGIIYIGGEPADEGYLKNLKAEAEALLVSDLWKVIYNTPKALAEKAMFIEGKTLEDLNKGRSMLYTLDTQKNILTTLAQVK